MPSNDPFRFAVIADAHFHDTAADFGFAGFPVDGRALVMRPLGHVARAPRLYNEASGALRFALDRVVARDIRDVILLGDYSDDGQAETLLRLEHLLDDYRHRHGIRFYAVPGNHDIFGDNGRHRRKRFLGAAGREVLVTSDPDFEPDRAGRIVSPQMYCAGYPENLPQNCGFFGAADALHWETPFGSDPDPASRLVEMTGPDGAVRPLMDASYLVEPRPGHWWAMIDANVFVPSPSGDDGLADSTSAGWKAILRHRAYLFDWLADVARRAESLGKRLTAFSHYPVLDPLDGTMDRERAIMADTGLHARVPPVDVARAFAATGIRLHFSGHVHVNDTARWNGAGRTALINIAVPALVAFPPAFKVVTEDDSQRLIETVSIDDMPLDPHLMQAYRLETALNGPDTGAMLEAGDYGRFASAHLGHITQRRYLKREWPAAMATLLRTRSLLDLLELSGLPVPAGQESVAAAIRGSDFLGDWYRLRHGGDLAFAHIDAGRLAVYRHIAAAARRMGDGRSVADPEARRLRLLFSTLAAHLRGLPTRRLRLDPRSGRIIGRR